MQEILDFINNYIVLILSLIGGVITIIGSIFAVVKYFKNKVSISKKISKEIFKEIVEDKCIEYIEDKEKLYPMRVLDKNENVYETLYDYMIKIQKEDKKHILMIGEGGIGKSFSLLRLYYDLIYNKTNFTPIYIELKDINLEKFDEHDNSIKELMINKITKEYLKTEETKFISNVEKDLTKRVKNPNFVLILDGFNEITNIPLAKSAVRKLFENFQNQNVKIIISSRYDFTKNEAYPKNIKIDKIHLLGLTDTEIKKILNKKIKNENKNELVQEKYNKLKKEMVLRNRMVLSIFIEFEIMISNYENNKYIIHPETIGEIYFNFIEYKKDQWKNEADTLFKLELEIVYDFMEYLSYEMLRENVYHIKKNRLEDKISEFLNGSLQPDKKRFDNRESYFKIENSNITLYNVHNPDKSKTYEISTLRIKVLNIIEQNFAFIIYRSKDDVYEFTHESYRDYFGSMYYQEELSEFIEKEDIKKLDEFRNPLPHKVINILSEINRSKNKEIKNIIDFKGLFESTLPNVYNNIKKIDYIYYNLFRILSKAYQNNLTGFNFNKLHFNYVNIYNIDVSKAKFTNINLNEYNIFPQGHTNSVNFIAYSNDSSKIMSVSSDNTIKEWNTITGECSYTLKGHLLWIRSVVYSSDNNKILSASSDDTIKEWEQNKTDKGEEWKCISTINHGSNEKNKGVRYATYNNNSDNKFISASYDGTMKEWERTIQDGKVIWNCIHTIDESKNSHTKMIYKVIYTSDNQYMISVSKDKTIKEWKKFIQDNDKEEWKCINTFDESNNGHSGEVTFIDMTKDNRYVITSSSDKTIKEWERTVNQNGNVDWKCINTISEKIGGHSNSVSSVSYSPDEKIILSSSKDMKLKLWKKIINENENNWIWEASDIEEEDNKFASIRPRMAIFSPDGKKIASTLSENVAEIELRTGDTINVFRGYPYLGKFVSYSNDADRILSSTSNNKLIEWYDNQRKVYRLSEEKNKHKSYLYTMLYSNNNKKIVTSSSDGAIKEWELNNSSGVWECRHTMGENNGGHKSFVYNACYSNDNNEILSSSFDGTIKIWRYNSSQDKWECSQTLSENDGGHKSFVYSSGYSHDDNMIYSFSYYDNSIIIWKRNNNKFDKHSVIYPDSKIRCVEFSNKSQDKLVTSHSDGKIIEWLYKNNEWIQNDIVIHSNENVRFINYSSDDTKVISASYDGKIKEWKKNKDDKFECINTLESTDEQKTPLKSAVYSSNDRRIISVAVDNTIKEWEYDNQSNSWKCIHTIPNMDGLRDNLNETDFTKAFLNLSKEQKIYLEYYNALL